MTWVDIAVILFSLLFVSYGFRRGFILEISDIAGVIISFFLTAYSPLPIGSRLFSYLLSFVLYFLLIHIIFHIISKILRHTPIVFIDRILGMVFGALKGLFFSLLIVFILTLFPIKYKPLTDSLSYRYVSIFTPYVISKLPHSFRGIDRKALKKQYEKIKRNTGI